MTMLNAPLHAAQQQRKAANLLKIQQIVLYPLFFRFMADILHNPVDIFLKQVKVTQRIALSFLTRAKASSCVHRAGVVSAASSAPSSFISPGEGVLPP